MPMNLSTFIGIEAVEKRLTYDKKGKVTYWTR